MLVTAELAQAGIRDDTYNGIRIRTVLLESGAELGANKFDFDAHGTVPRPGFVHTLHDLDRLHQFGQLDPEPLRSAIGQYLALYTDPPQQQPQQHRTTPAATIRADAARTRTTTPAPAAAPAGAATTTGPTGHRRAR
ncbi:hypothetical protein ACWDRR_18615 [Kitasatospora sp. NPDC003701]